MLVCYTDGLTEPNPNGIGTWGAIIIAHDGYKLYSGHGVVGVGKGMTNSVCEYAALIKCLKRLFTLNLFQEDIIIYSDSEMLVGQMIGHMRANKGEYIQYYLEAKILAGNFTSLRYQWIPRLMNKEADQLTRDAYIGYCKAHGLKTKFIKRHKKRDGHGKRISR